MQSNIFSIVQNSANVIICIITGMITGFISGLLVTKLVNKIQKGIDQERAFFNYKQDYVLYFERIESEIVIAEKNKNSDYLVRAVLDTNFYEGFGKMTDEEGNRILSEAKGLRDKLEGILKGSETDSEKIERCRQARSPEGKDILHILLAILCMKYVSGHKEKPNEFLTAYRKLNRMGRVTAVNQVKKLAENPLYQKKKLAGQNANKENDD